jgi:hypothetical protein
MTILVVHHAVRDFAAWKPAFDEHQPFRTAHGAIRHWLYRSPDDPDDLVVAIEFPSAEAALGFLADPSLKDAMERAGVIGEPSVHLREEIEAVEY